MDADLDLLLTEVFCIADDFLPEKPANARRILTDAEVVTLCVASRSWASPLTQGSSRSPQNAWGTSFPS
ncbi:MAG: hypothetical protein GEU88_17345 [Solirubrobacterales bacterium]|nr:hypothetical protein [Solirubrobacterales bacterium]